MKAAHSPDRQDLPVEATKAAILKALRLGALHKFQLIHHLPNPVPAHYNALRVALKELREAGLVSVKGERMAAVYFLSLPKEKA